MDKENLGLVLLVSAGLGLVPAYLHAYTLAGTSDIPTLLLGDSVMVSSAACRVNLPYSNMSFFGLVRQSAETWFCCMS